MAMLIRLKKDIAWNELSKYLNLQPQLLIDCNRTKNVLVTDIIDANTQIHIPAYTFADLGNNEWIEILTSENHVHREDKLLNTRKPYNSECLYADIDLLLEKFPFVKKEIIGYSVLGNPIIELTIGHGIKRVHMNGSFHANEWITTSIMMHWLHDYLNSLVKKEYFEGIDCYPLYLNTSISFVPMVNPDGVDLVRNGLPENTSLHDSLLAMNDQSLDFSQWKANIRGIDLNNQYPANWEIEKERKIPKSPAPRDYPGDTPLSEPESIALAELLRKRQFNRILAFHTQGEEIYWGYLRKEPDEAERIVNEFEKLSGYKAVRDIDSHAGFRDWFVNEWRRPGFTIELGIGVNPLPFSQFEEIYQKSKGIFLAALYM